MDDLRARRGMSVVLAARQGVTPVVSHSARGPASACRETTARAIAHCHESDPGQEQSTAPVIHRRDHRAEGRCGGEHLERSRRRLVALLRRGTWEFNDVGLMVRQETSIDDVQENQGRTYARRGDVERGDDFPLCWISSGTRPYSLALGTTTERVAGHAADARFHRKSVSATPSSRPRAGSRRAC